MPENVFVLSADLREGRRLAAVLVAGGYRAMVAPSSEIVASARADDMVIVSVQDPSLRELATCDSLRSRLGSQVIIVVLGPEDLPALGVAALDLGADDVVSTYVASEELLARLAAQRRRYHR